MSSQANGEVRALKDELSIYQQEIEVYQRQQEEIGTLKGQLSSLQRDHRNLQSKFELSEQEQMHLNGLKEESELKYRELVSSLQDQLKRSKLLRSTLNEQVSEESGIPELLEALLQQEQLHLLSHDSLKYDKEQLEREIKRLKKEVEDWKHLARNHEVLSQPSSQLHEDVPMDNIHVAESGTGYEQTIEQANSKIARLYALYRQAESHRKALVFQKRYLLCQMDAFYQTQEAALQMMADMGAPVEVTSFKVPRSKVSRSYKRFRAVGKVVLATLRFQYVRRRKIEYLQAKMSKLSRSPSVATTFGFSPPQVSTVSPPHPLHKASFMPSSSHFPPATTSTKSAGYPLNSGTTSLSLSARPTTSTSRGQSLPSEVVPKVHTDSKSKPKRKSVGSSLEHRHALSRNYPPSSSAKQKQKSKRVNPLSLPTATSEPPSTQDPQLAAYIKGLEKLQARLSKTKQ